MKVTRARRFWWRLMYDDPHEWDVWRVVAWAIPVVVGIVTVLVWWDYGRP